MALNNFFYCVSLIRFNASRCYEQEENKNYYSYVKKKNY